MFEIIPAIDLIDNQCVRLTQGDYQQKTIYHSSPLIVAQNFEAVGIQSLHIVDLSGAKAGTPQHLHWVEQIAKHTQLRIDYGGGIREEQHIKDILSAGASMVSIGSIAVKNQTLVGTWLAQFGGEVILLAADVKEEYIALQAWQETSHITVFDWVAEYEKMGLTQFFCTDVARDGMLTGANVALYQKLKAHFPNLRILASGGVGSWADIEALQQLDIAGVIVGKALYEGKIDIQQIQKYIQS
ncbi:MAG: 1-(5-phosphoribosyl)-5-[(5-phosphoribosylamino)methylideneamino]imidazole-4-carboxamide isomerase [Cytophagales bacterium]|nr:MAG: 1-(5-phosphoribosyl)-5-[(5-phosphoribosylamino)methylideneamino]imidazole-4-carboxamide isomerase [Cytophagales bacterium]